MLVDLAMPVLDGLEALPALRRACPAARIVVLSGFDASRMLARRVAAGADGYLQKGLTPGSSRNGCCGSPEPPAPSLPAPAPSPPADLLDARRSGC